MVLEKSHEVFFLAIRAKNKKMERGGGETYQVFFLAIGAPPMVAERVHHPSEFRGCRGIIET